LYKFMKMPSIPKTAEQQKISIIRATQQVDVGKVAGFVQNWTAVVACHVTKEAFNRTAAVNV